MQIKVNDIALDGILNVPEEVRGVVIFVHGSGSSRLSPRNVYVAEKLNIGGFATLLFDLLTVVENLEYMNRFNIDLLTTRLKVVTEWIKYNDSTKDLPIGYFGASTGAAAALNAAAELPNDIKAIVSRGGRPDLAEEHLLRRVKCPVLLIVGEKDEIVIDLNRDAAEKIISQKKIMVVPGASHLFEEPGALISVADLAVEWFRECL